MRKLFRLVVVLGTIGIAAFGAAPGLIVGSAAADTGEKKLAMRSLPVPELERACDDRFPFNRNTAVCETALVVSFQAALQNQILEEGRICLPINEITTEMLRERFREAIEHNPGWRRSFAGHALLLIWRPMFACKD